MLVVVVVVVVGGMWMCVRGAGGVCGECVCGVCLASACSKGHVLWGGDGCVCGSVLVCGCRSDCAVEWGCVMGV
jgi:hypothetical protein